MKIELIYFDGCPNIEAAGENIREACRQAEIDNSFKEWNQNDKNAPSYVQGYGSPTVLVNGKDIAGGKNDCCKTGACRIYADMTGVPSVDLIKKH